MLFVSYVVVRPIKLIEFTTVSPWPTQNWIYDLKGRIDRLPFAAKWVQLH